MCGPFVKVLHPLARNLLGRTNERHDVCDAAVLRVAMLIERGHIDARHLRQPPQNLFARGAFGFRLVIGIHERRHDDLALANDEGINDSRQRFGIERRAGPARDDERVAFAALGRAHLYMAELENLDDVEVVHLERDRETDDREIRERRLVL